MNLAELAQGGFQRSPAARLSDIDPVIKVDGHPLDFHRFGWVPRWIDDTHPRIVIIKGAQIGATVAIVLKVIERMRAEALRGVVYYFPTKDDVSDFSKARFSRMLEDNPELEAAVRDHDSVSVKRIGEGFVYFRGANSRSGMKSVPGDILVFDERDEMAIENVALARHRLDAPETETERQEISLSTPDLPETGVDFDYSQSDQHVWQIPCSGCKTWNCLELRDWPGAFEQQRDGTWIRACSECGKEILPSDGEWVAASPDSERVRGYWISQLCSREPDAIMADWEEAQRLGQIKEFYNSVLGRAYADVDQILTDEMIQAVINEDQPRVEADPGPGFMGADVGGKDFHWTAGKRINRTVSQILAFGKIGTETEVGRQENRLLDQFDAFNTERMVVDQMAESRTVARLKERRPGRIFGCVYTEAQHLGADWDYTTNEVHVNRSDALDGTHQKVLRREFLFPRRDDTFRKEVVPQLKNLARKRVPKRSAMGLETGQSRVIWVVRGVKNDHYRHGLTYADLAQEGVGVATDAVRRKKPYKAKGLMSR